MDAEARSDPGTLEVLEFLAWLEANRLARRDVDLNSGLRVATDSPLAVAHLEDAETPKLDALPLINASFIASMMVSTAAAALTLETSELSATRFTMSALIMSFLPPTTTETGDSVGYLQEPRCPERAHSFFPNFVRVRPARYEAR